MLLLLARNALEENRGGSSQRGGGDVNGKGDLQLLSFRVYVCLNQTYIYEKDYFL